MKKVVVLALHATRGDPERSVDEFAYLKSQQRGFELIHFGDGYDVREQLEGVLGRYPQARITVAPLLLARGFHYSNELVFALEDIGSERLNLAPLWGESLAFRELVRGRLHELFQKHVEKVRRGVTWFVPGGPLAARQVRDIVTDAIPVDLQNVPQRWINHGSVGALKDSFGVICVVRRGGKLSQFIQSENTGCSHSVELFDESLYPGISDWIEESVSTPLPA